ncbi:MAG TPA: hypothetical protein VF487_04320 [Chitinophagaceae bacterium]
MKPLLLLIAIYSLIFQQYQHRRAEQKEEREIKATPSPKPVMTTNTTDSLITRNTAVFYGLFRRDVLFNALQVR